MTLYSMGWGDGKPKTKKQLEKELYEISIELSAYLLVMLDLGYKHEFIEKKVKEKVNMLNNIKNIGV